MFSRTFLITLLFLSNSFNVLSASNELRLLHKIKLNSCLRVKDCGEAKIKQCREIMKKAFDNCDSQFDEASKSTNKWGGCVAKYLTSHMTGQEFGYLMHGQACQEPDRKAEHAGGGMPRAAENPLYFSAMSMDIKNPVLHHSPSAACGAGAKRSEKLINSKYKDMRIDIEISGAKKTNAVSGKGDNSYSLLLGKAVHKYGKCKGKKYGTYLKNRGRHKKGDTIENDYGDVVYVVIDCKSSPKPSVCD